MLSEYVPILILFLVILGFVTVSILASEILGRKRGTRGKFRTYECGMTPKGNARGRFSVKFFLVAVLFILFDIESVFLIPLGVNLRAMTADGNGLFLMMEMLLFILVLFLGLFYIWRKGGLEWD
jgi:NADH-quinone oxidoreductase subunit A